MIVDQIYHHYKDKNKRYRLITYAKHTETLEEMVVYEALYDNSESKVWVRPRAMFEGMVEVDGVVMKRFERVDE